MEEDFTISHDRDTTEIQFHDGAIAKNYRITATKNDMAATVDVWVMPPNLRSTEELEQPKSHLFFRTSDGQFLNIGSDE